MRLNQLDGLLAFWKVAEHRGFTAAAAELEVSPSALSQAIRHLEARLGVRLLNRTTRSVSLTEAGEAYLTRIGPALRDVREAGEQLHALRGRPSGVLRINAARIGTAMVLRPLLAGFLKAYPDVQVELTNDEGYVDIVERGFDAGVRLGESVQKDMVAVPLGSPVAVAIVGSPDYFNRHAAPRHPSDLVHHNCVRFRFSGSGAIYKWELQVRVHVRAPRTSTPPSQEVEARVEQLFAYVSRVLPVLPQQTAAAFQVEGLRRLRAGAFPQARKFARNRVAKSLSAHRRSRRKRARRNYVLPYVSLSRFDLTDTPTAPLP